VQIELLVAQLGGVAAEIRLVIIGQAIVSLGNAEGLWGEPECECDVLFRSSWHSQQYARVCEAIFHSRNTFHHSRIIEPPTAFALSANLVKNWPAAISLSSSS
jgi:hypothetical protein